MALIGYFVSPSGFISICLLIGLAAVIHRRTRRLGHVCLSVGALMYLVLSLGPVSYALLKPLEFQYDAFDAEAKSAEAGYIVVMAGYALDMDYYPLSSKANAASTFRIMEAYHIWRSDPSRLIVVSGYREVPEIMARVLAAMGVPEENTIVENRSYNSYESAKNVEKIIRGAQFILVTSAGHMPRCMGIFHKHGMNPIPAPTDFQAGKDPFSASFAPTVEHMRFSEMALHEYVGILWYRLRGYL